MLDETSDKFFWLETSVFQKNMKISKQAIINEQSSTFCFVRILIECTGFPRYMREKKELPI